MNLRKKTLFTRWDHAGAKADSRLCGIAGHVIKTGEVVNTADNSGSEFSDMLVSERMSPARPQADFATDATSDSKLEDLDGQAGPITACRHVLCVPVMGRDVVVGALQVGSYREVGSYSAQAEDLLKSLANAVLESMWAISKDL